MPFYDAVIFHPPAPVARVVLRDPSSGRSAADVPMLMDSGADVTLLPRLSLERLGVDAATGEEYELTAFDGTILFHGRSPCTCCFFAARSEGVF